MRPIESLELYEEITKPADVSYLYPIRPQDFLVGDVCKYCDKDCLTWRFERGRWKLYDKDKVHRCDDARSVRQRSSEFENN